MRRDAKSQLDHTTVAHNRFALTKTDLHIMMVQEGLIEWIDRFVHGLLGDEEQPSTVRIITYSQPLLRRCNQFQQFRWQWIGRLNVDADGINVTAHSNCCHCNLSIVGKRTDNTCGKGRRSSGSFRYRALRLPKSLQQLTRDDTSRAT